MSFLRIRPASTDIDQAILDITAGLIARRGIKDTAVQAIADAAGYSKAGILNRFPSKQILVDAAIQQCFTFSREIVVSVDAIRDPSVRDAACLERLTDLALLRRGWIELTLAALPARSDDELHQRLEPLAADLWHMFAGPGSPSVSLQRRSRVAGALAALAVLSLTYDTLAGAAEARPLILCTSWNALGHPGSYPSNLLSTSTSSSV